MKPFYHEAGIASNRYSVSNSHKLNHVSQSMNESTCSRFCKQCNSSIVGTCNPRYLNTKLERKGISFHAINAIEEPLNKMEEKILTASIFFLMK